MTAAQRNPQKPIHSVTYLEAGKLKEFTSDEFEGARRWGIEAMLFVERELGDRALPGSDAYTRIFEKREHHLGGYTIGANGKVREGSVLRGYNGVLPPKGGEWLVTIPVTERAAIGLHISDKREIDSVYIDVADDDRSRRRYFFKLETLDGLRMGLMLSEAVNEFERRAKIWENQTGERKGIMNITEFRRLMADIAGKN